MVRMLLLLLMVFGTSFVSLVLIYALFSITSVWLVNEMNMFNVNLQIDVHLLGSFFEAAIFPGIMFGCVITVLLCLILYRALQKKQHIKVQHFISIFRSFLVFTFFLALAYHTFIVFIILSKSGVFLLLPFTDVLGYFFDYALPFIWIMLAFYWYKKYEDKFLDDEAELFLK